MLIYNLQTLRAFAALNVVLYHIIGASESYGFSTEVIVLLKGWGANGVDIFFVISGFVMLFTQLENKRSVINFLKLRIIRIAPIYWLLTLLVVLIYLVFPDAFREMKITPEWVFASLGFLSLAIIGEDPIVYVGWTLEWEMLFYFVFGLSLWFRSWLVVFCSTIFILLIIAVLASNFILVEFIAGMAIALTVKKFGITAYGRTALVAGFILLSLSVIPSIRDLVESRVIIWGFPSMLIIYGAVTSVQIKSQVAMLIGDASYSIYLIQVLSIPVFYKFASYSGLEFNNDILALLCLLATAFGGVFMYSVIEKPITHFLKKRLA